PAGAPPPPRPSPARGGGRWRARRRDGSGGFAMKQSAGTLLYREGPGGLEVLIVHPSGSYNRHAPWSIPKGVPDEDETDDLAATDLRETLEETGVREAGGLADMGSIDYMKSRKRVYCFAVTAHDGEAPRQVSIEVDRARTVR